MFEKQLNHFGDVVDVVDGRIITSRQRIESTEEARRLAQESLDAGVERLKAGTGTTFEVLELQKKLAESQSSELGARADYNSRGEPSEAESSRQPPYELSDRCGRADRHEQGTARQDKRRRGEPAQP